jgi:uncharacterized damage-inducible protein DinB
VREILESVEHEYRRYKGLAEATFAQLAAEQLTHVPATESNSIAMLAWHISGNLRSRFTDFLTTDGEKPWRDRESEFDARQVSHEELRRKWEDGWPVLFATLGQLSDDDLRKQVVIRGEPHAVHAALHRSLAHTANHVGQIVLLGKMLRGAEWRSLSIPRRGRTA